MSMHVYEMIPSISATRTTLLSLFKDVMGAYPLAEFGPCGDITHISANAWLDVKRRDPHGFAQAHALLAESPGQNDDHGMSDVLCVLATAGCDRRIGSKRTPGHSAGSEVEGDG